MLRNAASRGRLGHTLLFAGPHGVGKRVVARALAQSLFCSRHDETELEACGECPGCKQVLAGTHPDLLTVARPEGKSTIPIALLLGEDELRGKSGLCYELSLRPLSGARKVAIIDEAEYLGDEAANALLKTLEEPPPGAVLILIADAPESLLATIRSRCQVLRFGPLSQGDLAPLIVSQGLASDPATAESISRLADGTLAQARALVEPELRDRRDVIFRELAASPFNSVELAKTLWTAIEAAAADTSEQRAHAHWVIRFTTDFYRQALHALTGCPDPDPRPRAFADRLPRSPDALDRVAQLLDRCLAAESEIDGNVTVALWVEVFFQSLATIQRA